MAIKRRIRCVTKDDDDDILSVGNAGATWSPRSVSSVIKDIDAKTYEYYVDECGHESKVVVVRPSSGKAYIKTTADGYTDNNLDNLSAC